MAELASDYDTQERIPYNDKLKITKIFAYVDTSARNGFAVNNVYYEPSHFNTGVAPIYLKYTYRYGKTGVLESKDQTALKQDWQDEIRTIKISISRFFKKLPMPVRIALVMIRLQFMVKIHQLLDKLRILLNPTIDLYLIIFVYMITYEYIFYDYGVVRRAP